MAQRGRPTAEIVLCDHECETLEQWACRRKTGQALVLRCWIVLAAATGATRGVVNERSPGPYSDHRTRARRRDIGPLITPSPLRPEAARDPAFCSPGPAHYRLYAANAGWRPRILRVGTVVH